MSYILDALRRADAERQRGALPDLYAQPADALGLPAAREAAPRAGRWAAVAALELVLLGTALAAWWWRGAPPAARPAAAGSAEKAAPVAASTLPPSTAPAATPLAAQDAPAAVLAQAAPAAQPARLPPAPMALPEPPRPTVERAADSGAAAARAVPPPPGGARDAAPAVATAPAKLATPPAEPRSGAPAIAAADQAVGTPSAPAAALADPASGRGAAIAPQTRLPTLAELPADMRQQLPPLALGGLVHAQQPRQRLAVVNGQVLREGDRAAPELTVEQIRPRSVVFNLRGQRFEVAQ